MKHGPPATPLSRLSFVASMNFRQSTEDLFEKTRMSFGQHLEELRTTLIKCVAAVAVGCVVGFTFANHTVEYLKGPLVTAMAEFKSSTAAEEMIERLSGLLRNVLAVGEKQRIPLREELNLLRDYLAIEAVRFSDRLTIEEDMTALFTGLCIVLKEQTASTVE